MKYCTECGEKLAQPNPKHCPECGTILRTEAAPKAERERTEAQGTGAERVAPAAGTLKQIGRVLGVLAVAFLAFVFMLAAIAYPFVQMDRAATAGRQYYTYLTAASEDLNEVEWLSKQYGYILLSNEAFDRKAQAAANYSTKARQAVTSWEYFRLFIRQNEAPLRKWSVDTAPAISKIDTGKLSVRNTARAMAAELEPLASGDSEKAALITDTLKTLKELSQ